MKFSNIITKFLFITVLITGLNSCKYIGVLAMAIGEKTTIDTWKYDKYKVRIQRRMGWSGPHFYHCRVKEKRLGGLYYKTILDQAFSREKYALCIVGFPLKSDTLTIDICKKTISTTSITNKNARN